MVIPTNDKGLPPLHMYTIQYNRITGKFDVYFESEIGQVPIYPVQSYMAGEEAVRSFVAGWNAAEQSHLDEQDIQSDEMPEADSFPPDLQDLLESMDANELEESWSDYQESNMPDESYERIHTAYDPLRYE